MLGFYPPWRGSSLSFEVAHFPSPSRYGRVGRSSGRGGPSPGLICPTLVKLPCSFLQHVSPPQRPIILTSVQLQKPLARGGATSSCVFSFMPRHNSFLSSLRPVFGKSTLIGRSAFYGQALSSLRLDSPRGRVESSLSEGRGTSSCFQFHAPPQLIPVFSEACWEVYVDWSSGILWPSPLLAKARLSRRGE